MTKEEKKAYVALSRRRYSELKPKKEKGEFLDGFCPVMGMDKKSAIRLFSLRGKPHLRHNRPFATGIDARKLLVAIWKKAGRRPFGVVSVSSGYGKDEGNGMNQEPTNRSVTPFMMQPRKCHRHFR